jgi:hypothetical protein
MASSCSLGYPSIGSTTVEPTLLWACDIALVLVALSVWSKRPLFNSMMAIGALPYEIAPIADFFSAARMIGMTS